MKTTEMGKCRLIVKLAAALVAVATGCSALAAEKRPMAILFMLDGLRADAVESGQMPNLVKLQKGEWCAGYGCAWTLSGFVNAGVAPESAPNHASIATGVTYLKHLVKANGQTGSGDYANYPTWLKRVVEADSNRSALFAYSWAEDAQLGPTPDVEFVSGTDAANSSAVSARLAAADAPDATMFYINCPDAGGHASGYYPHGAGYAENVAAADSYIGACLDAIAGRATFAEEDWLVLVTSDHGGFTVDHAGAYGRHSLTVPVLVAGRGVSAGPVSGVVYNYDLTANALAHFGIDAAACSLDARAVAGVAAATRPLADGLSVYLPFNNFDNGVPGSAVTAIANDADKATIADNGFTGRGLKIVAGGAVKLQGSENLTYEDSGKSFAITVWVRQDQTKMTGDPLVWGNKNWNAGRNPGLALVAYGKPSGNPEGSNVFFNYVTTGTERHDIGQFLNEGTTLWNFYAVTRTDDGVVRVYQGRRDGRLYWLSDEAAQFTLSQTKYPFYLGSDGTGTYTRQYIGEMDEFALWTRGLSHEEIRKVYEAGRRGQELGDVLAVEALDTPTVSVAAYDGTTATLAFGGVRTSPYTLCVASGATDAGEDKYAWEHFDTVAEIAAGTSQHVFTLPDAFKSERRKFKFFLLKTADLPYTKELRDLASDGTSAVDTGICPRSGTSISLDVMATAKNGNYDWFFGAYWHDGSATSKVANFGVAFRNNVNPASIYYESANGTAGVGYNFLPYELNTYYHVDYTMSSIAVDGVSGLTGRTAADYREHGFTIELFRDRRNLSAYDQTVKGRIGDVTLRADGETLRELVPVADLAGKGAYFDRVTGRIHPEVAGTPLTLGAEREASRLGWVRTVSPTLDGDAARVAVACWTGRGETSAVSNPDNWACTNAIGARVDGLPTAETTVFVSGRVSFSVLPGETVAHAGKIVMKGFQLAGDCDLRGLGMDEISDDSVIDLNGHNLTFAHDAETSAAFTVTDSTAGAEPGRLHLVVSAGKTADIPTKLVFAGNLRIVKDGPGTILAKAAARGHQGGIEVAEGTLSLGATISAMSAPFGPAGAPVMVDAGAVFDPRGYSGLERYTVVLNGGTFSNSNANTTIGSLTLTADSRMDFPDTTASHDVFVKGGAIWNLGGKTLTIAFAGNDPDLYFQESGVVIRNGTILNTGDGYFNMYADVDMSDGVTLDIATRLRLHLTGAKVENLINRTPYDNVSSRSADGTEDYYLSLSGRFTPLSEYCYFMLLQDGATIDLRQRTGAWPLETTVTWGGKPYVTRTKFADGATVTVDLAGREDLATGVKVIDFGSTPFADLVTFKLDAETAKVYMLDRRADGVYLVADVATAIWSGAAGDGDVGNEGNWSCFDAAGKPIADVRPGSSTKVTVTGEVFMAANETKPLVCASIEFRNASLARDCDWRTFAMPLSGTLDLKGHDLVCTHLDWSFEVTDTGRTDGQKELHGALHLIVPTGTSELSALRLTGGLRLVKEGPGTLVMGAAGQSYTGGTQVAAGMIVCGDSPSSATLPFGSAGSSITVDAGTVLDPRGHSGLERYTVVLNGGTFSNSNGNTTIGNLTLTADSLMDFPDTTASHDVLVKGGAIWDLGGKVLTIAFAGTDPDLAFREAGVVIRNGTIVNVGDGFFYINADVDMSDGVTLDIATRLRLIHPDVKVENLINRALYENVTSRDATGKTSYYMSLSGRFTPLSPYCYFMLLQDGATIDLGARTDVWPLETTVTFGGKPYETRTTFADGATIWIDLGDRRYHEETQVVSWSTKPDNLNTLHFRCKDGRHRFAVRDSGVYACPSGFRMIVR